MNQGREAITHYHTVATTKRYSWLTLRSETGRKNQIRVHCQSAGHPVVGDKKYGAQTNPLKRLCLHAHLLAFQHPFSPKNRCASNLLFPKNSTDSCHLSVHKSPHASKSLLDRIFRPDGNHYRHIFRHYRLCSMGIFKT